MQVVLKRVFDGGSIAMVDGWCMGDAHSPFACRNNGRTYSEWDRRPMTEEEIVATKAAYEAAREASEE